MPSAALVADALPDAADARAETVRELQERIRRMQRSRLDTRALPTHPALVDLLPGGALAAGSAYAVDGSTTLALALLQGPSAAGAWCAVVGMPDLGVEAATGLGVDADRLVLVPHPGEQWLAVVSALVDVVSVVLVRPPRRGAGRARGGAGGGAPAPDAAPAGAGAGPPGASVGIAVGEAAASGLAARLRQREAVLVSIGDWPRATARLRVSDVSWAGIGQGFGRLVGRQATVSAVAAAGAGRPISRRLWLPGPDAGIAPVDPRPVDPGVRGATELDPAGPGADAVGVGAEARPHLRSIVR